MQQLQDSERTQRFIAAVEPPHGAESAIWLIFREQEVLLQTDSNGHRLPRFKTATESGLATSHENFLGFLDGTPCFAAEVPEDSAAPPEMVFTNMRRLFALLGEFYFGLAGRARQIVSWDKTHTFCGQCGCETKLMQNERARICPNCGLAAYPRLSPAVIVLIERGDELLLGRSPRLPEGMYSVLAGFVEPGETLEETVHREIREEVGIGVTNLRYFGSQPWPFPNSLMIGFVAEYESGELDIDKDELEDARWCTQDNLPLIPSEMSIARRLIDHFFEKRRPPLK